MPVGPPLHGFRAGVVRLVDYRREEFVDRHPSSRKTAGRRPFLLLLSPDTLQLSTASDATDEGSGEFFDKGSLLHMASMRQQRPPRTPGKPLALLHKLAHGGSPSGKGAAAPAEGGGGEARGGSMDGASRLLLDGEPLEEGQLLTFSIALSQISGVECEGRRIKVGPFACCEPGGADPAPAFSCAASTRCARSGAGRLPCGASSAGDVCAAAPAPQHRIERRLEGGRKGPRPAFCHAL